MHTLLIFALSITTAYLMSRVRRTAFTRSELAVALYSGIIGAVLAFVERSSGIEWGTLPVLLAVLLTLGLQAVNDGEKAW